MNAIQEINGKLYERVPDKVGTCSGCAFHVPDSWPKTCQVDQGVRCTIPGYVIFVEVLSDPRPNQDEQCGVGNG